MLLALTSCGRVKNYAIDADLKTHFNYNVGTYWIYKDSASGRVDSFAVFYNQYTPAGVSTADQHTADDINIGIEEFNTTGLLDSTQWSWYLVSNIIEIDRYVIANGTDYNIQYYSFVSYPFQTGEVGSSIIVPNAYSNGLVTNIFPSYSVNGQAFSQVAEIYFNDSTSVPPYHADWFYLSQDTGIIKMRLYGQADSPQKVWELQRWHIVK